MAIAAIGGVGSERAAYARDARIARVLALVVDVLLFSVISAVVNAVYGVSVLISGSPLTTAWGGYAYYSTSVGWFWLTLLYLLYATVPEATFGATPGKLLLRLRVVRLDGQPLDLRAMLIRNLMRLIDALPLLYLVGGVSVLATRGSQRLGDLAAGTTVVYRHRALEPGATRHPSRTAVRVLATSLVAALAFTIAFAYFGRPPLVIAGLYNEHRLLTGDVVSYSLGGAKWGSGEVTYPITGQRPTTKCTGSITLRWYAWGWQMSGASYTCSPS